MDLLGTPPMPESAHQWGAWLDENLLDLVFAGADSGEGPAAAELLALLGESVPALMEGGFEGLPAELFAAMDRPLREPATLSLLQDLVLVRGGAFWQRKLLDADAPAGFDDQEIRREVRATLLHRIAGDAPRSRRRRPEAEAPVQGPPASRKQTVLACAALFGLLAVGALLAASELRRRDEAVEQGERTAALSGQVGALSEKLEREAGNARGHSAALLQRGQEWKKEQSGLLARIGEIKNGLQARDHDLQKSRKDLLDAVAKFNKADDGRGKLEQELSVATASVKEKETSLEERRKEIKALEDKIAKAQPASRSLLAETITLKSNQAKEFTVGLPPSVVSSTLVVYVLGGQSEPGSGGARVVPRQGRYDLELRVFQADSKTAVRSDIDGFTEQRAVRINLRPDQTYRIQVLNTSGGEPNRVHVFAFLE